MRLKAGGRTLRFSRPGYTSRADRSRGGAQVKLLHRKGDEDKLEGDERERRARPLPDEATEPQP
jgi:hypothetical protein